MNAPSLRVEGLRVELGGVAVLPGENLEIEGAGLVTVIGPNGAGKTTFFRALMGLLRPSRGRVLVNGVDVTGSPERAGAFMSYVPQLSAFNREYPITVREFVESALSLKSSRPPRILTPREIRVRARRALRAVGAEDFSEKPLNSLSGGQLQRTLIARAVALDTPIMLLDEPISAVDPAGKREIVELLSRLAGEKLVLVTSHDPALYAGYSRLIVVMNRGIRLVGPPEEVLDVDKLSSIYGGSVMLVEKCVHLVDSHAA